MLPLFSNGAASRTFYPRRRMQLSYRSGTECGVKGAGPLGDAVATWWCRIPGSSCQALPCGGRVMPR